MLSNEALSTELTEMCLRLLLRGRSDLHDSRLLILSLLLLLLRDLHCLLLNDLLFNLSVRLLGLRLLRLLMNLNLLMLRSVIRTLQNLVDDFTARCNDLNWYRR